MAVAIDVVEDLILSQFHSVSPEWDNAVCKLGFLVRQMGVLPAITVYTQTSEASAVSKKVILHCIQRILLITESQPYEEILEYEAWRELFTSDPNLKKKLEKAIIALKLALRIFIEKNYEKES
ncbi:MAG: hypothetical protein WBK97_07365 [Bacteroidales bacterium]